ncbi:MAG: hypothetical protein QOG67_2365 [Verrucomicrobiota bacterium]
MRRIILSAIVSAFIGMCAGFSDVFAITLYGTAYSGSSGMATLYMIDSTTGIGTPVGLGTGYTRVGAIDFDPLTGILYGIGTDTSTDAVDLIKINTMTGMATTVGFTGIYFSNNFQDISFRSDGTLFGVANGTAYTIDLITGAASALGATSLGKFGSGLAFDPSNTLYNINGATIGTIDQMSGAGTTTGTTVTYPSDLFNPRPNAMDYDLTSGILYASVVHGGGDLANAVPTSIDGGISLTANFIAQIDVATGNVTGVFATVNGLDGLAVAPTAPTSVPDALSTLWLALPLCGLFALTRLRPSYSVALNRSGAS